MNADLRPGDWVRYLDADVFDRIIRRGDLGEVTRIDAGWVHAKWPSGTHSVPLAAVERVSQGGDHPEEGPATHRSSSPPTPL